MLSWQEEQAERLRTLLNDARVREQEQARGSTFHQFAQADAQTPRGRFTQVEAATVVGANPVMNYPAASAAHQIQLPDEPPLGFDNPALLEPSHLAAQGNSGGSASAPSTPDVQHTEPPFSPDPMVAQRMSQMASSSARGDDVRTERPPEQLKRRRL
jgi:hypothetical protein